MLTAIIEVSFASASYLHANNEIGTIQPIREIGAIACEGGISFHTDAAQSVGKISTNVNALGINLLTIAGYKFYAPKGVGALYVRRGVTLEPLIHGAGRESGRRAGSETALLATGLGEACALVEDLRPMEQVCALRDRFWTALKETFGNQVVLNGHPDHRLPNTRNVCFTGRVGAELLASPDGVAAQTGSACHSGRVELSTVLAAMGAVHFSLGRSTTQEEIDPLLEQLVKVLLG